MPIEQTVVLPQHDIKTDSSGRSFIELDGQKVEFGESFNTNPVGIQDIFAIMMSQFRSSSLGKLLTKFGDDLKSGEETAILIAGTVVVGGLLLYYILSSSAESDVESGKSHAGKGKEDEEDEEEEVEPPRDFTVEQLREFDGTNGKPIYIGLKRDVFDVSNARDFYGEGSGYHCFAGREASRAMALLSFDESELSNLNIDDLGAFGRNTLDDWYEKFRHYKSYPIVGRVSVPPKDLKLKRSELKEFVGSSQVPEGRIDAPIYIGLRGKIFDVSYGGKELYKVPDGSYSVFAGIDASRALAKMSFDPSDLQSSDLSDLTADEQKVLDGWVAKFENTKKYPVIGKLIDE